MYEYGLETLLRGLLNNGGGVNVYSFDFVFLNSVYQSITHHPLNSKVGSRQIKVLDKRVMVCSDGE